jgi:DNA repair protein RecN (Recombination protein N)
VLVRLHVKNFAIINEIEIDFKEHLNIMTGETGAGKSIIIGSINAALGAKVNKDILRSGADYALVELVFETSDETVISTLQKMDLPIEDGMIIITRKIMPGRSICKINGESVTTAVLATIAGLLIDIHGQHEHQSLLNKEKHLMIVDRFAKDEIESLKEDLSAKYKEYLRIKQEFDKAETDEEKRNREISFLEYEINEIQSAALKAGEDEELEAAYRKLSNVNAISQGLSEVYSLIGNETAAAGDSIGRALKILTRISEYDETVSSFFNQTAQIEDCLNGLNKDIAEYISEMDDPQELLEETGNRLDLINHLKARYGNTVEQINRYCRDCEARLEKYRDYDAYRKKLGQDMHEAEENVKDMSQKLSDIRQKRAGQLAENIREALRSLNFLDVKFEMIFHRLNHYTANGFDDAEFLISTNPGEALRPLSKVASGGELSRIMLGIKSVLADKDEIETLIFDEIDTGISGRTAQKVSEQLANISRHHQIICITHLAQIAAMADAHYVIEKHTDGVSTQTVIKELNPEEIIEELSRILGGAKITDRVRESAKEMKQLAFCHKKI